MDQSEIDRMLAAAGPELREALDAAASRGLSPLRMPPPLRLSQWAERHFYLSAESSYVEGRWRCYPFQRAILDCIGHDDIQVVDLRKSARVGYTKMVLAGIAYFAEHKRRNQVLYQPTDDDRDEFVTTELDPMLRDVKIMRSVFPKMHSRSKDNTMRLKMFLTGALHLRGGKAAKNYRRITADVVWYDELDGFDRDIEGEGSPLKLGDKRLEGSTFPKSVRGTTPKAKGRSHIEDCEAGADLQMRFCIPCPHCHEEHPLVPGRLDPWSGGNAQHGFAWVDDDPTTVRHVCPHCGVGIQQAEYLQVWEAGRWMAENGTWIDSECRFIGAGGTVIPPPRHLAVHIWTAYSPQAAWSDMVREFLDASVLAERGDFSTMKTFVNTTLGQTWEEKAESADDNDLMQRAKAEDPPYKLGAVPTGCLVLTAGVDVQDDRFEVVVWGFGRNAEMWVVDVRVFRANPADERDWKQLDDYLATRFEHAWSGVQLGLQAVAIDTQGHFTHQVYNFVRLREHRRIVGIRGRNAYGGPIKGTANLQDVNWQGRIVKEGVRVWQVGTDTAKNLLFQRLSLVQPGPGYVHFAIDLPPAFYRQLTAEERRKVRTSRGEDERWMLRTGQKRNEKLDCTVYALFAFELLDLSGTDDATARRWDQIEAYVQPPRDVGGASIPPPPASGRRMLNRGLR